MQNIESKIENTIEVLSTYVTKFGRVVDLIFLWLSLFDVRLIDIKNGHFLRDQKASGITYPPNWDSISNAEKIILRMEKEYELRKSSSAEKVKILFQILILTFTAMSATMAYIVKDMHQPISKTFVFSLFFALICLYNIISYYRVSTVNAISFDINDTSRKTFLSDRIFCLSMNNSRLDYIVTLYKSALRYFYIALIFLIIAFYCQFKYIIEK